MTDTGSPGSKADMEEAVAMRRKQYKCPYFCILVIGRANAGKTTILEKVCGVAKGTKPVFIYDEEGDELEPDETHVTPSIERGIHDIEHQITYEGSNFIFHDSQGFESGAREELEVVWDFIEKKSNAPHLRDQLHAIWYCLPMDSARPILPTELEFFNKGTGKAPLVVVFTKFDGLIVQESGKLNDIEDDEVKWNIARKNAEITLQRVYLPKVFETKYPPKAYVCLEDMDMPENDCPELTKKTADVIDDASLRELFVSTQKNNLDLCVQYALEHVLRRDNTTWEDAFIIALSKFPHYWAGREQDDEGHDTQHCIKQHDEIDWFEMADEMAENERRNYLEYDNFDSNHGLGVLGLLNDHLARNKRRQFFKRKILPQLLSSFGNHITQFSETPTACQILAAITIIAKLSFWVAKPAEELIIAEEMPLFEQSITEASYQFKRGGYVEKLKSCITSDSLPSGYDDLVPFMFAQTCTQTLAIG